MWTIDDLNTWQTKPNLISVIGYSDNAYFEFGCLRHQKFNVISGCRQCNNAKLARVCINDFEGLYSD
jgi:hypothetical protein